MDSSLEAIYMGVNRSLLVLLQINSFSSPPTSNSVICNKDKLTKLKYMSFIRTTISLAGLKRQQRKEPW